MNQIYCSNCGQLIPAESNFCKFCGAAQHGAEAAAYRFNAPQADSAEQARKEYKAEHKGYQPEFYLAQNLGGDAILYFLFSNIAKTILVLGLLIVGLFFMAQLFALLLITYFVLVGIATLLMYNNFIYEINEEGLSVKTGVIHKSSVSVPFDQVQNVNIERTVLDQILGIAKVSIETAGNSNGGSANGVPGTKVKAEAYLPGLSPEKAKKIHDLLIDGSDGIFGN